METNKSAWDVISADGNQAAPARITVSPDSLSPSHPGRKVCALINTLSGNRTDAAYLASELRLILGAANVQDISLCFVGGTEGIAANERARRLIHEQATICGVVMIAGGDGTVSFVMDLVDQVLSGNRFSPVLKYPRLSIIPLGTGNDLSRSLGFGGGFRVRRPLSCCTSMHGNKDAQEALDRALITKFETMLNRCLLRYHHSDEGERVLRMTNYFSVGFDAFVAQKFDSFRRRNPNLCSSRAMNKLAYACFGFGAMFRKNMLRNALELSVDGIRVPIPDDIHAVVVVNIDKYAGGVTLWNPKESQNGFRPQQSDDGILEVCGLKGPTDLALNITGLRKGARALAQGCCIKLVCSRPLPMQWDGEVLKVSSFQEQDGVVDITIEVSSSARFLSHRP